jgi:hypothetical protein
MFSYTPFPPALDHGVAEQQLYLFPREQRFFFLLTVMLPSSGYRTNLSGPGFAKWDSPLLRAGAA